MPTAHHVVFRAPREVAVEPVAIAPPGPGEVLARATCSLISTGTELTALSGEFPPDSGWARYVRYPWVAGYSFVGVVEAVGEEVDTFRPGDRVGSFARHSTHATFAAARAWHLPAGVTDEEAAFAVLAEIAFNGVRRGRVTFGESVAIVGAGLLGQLAAQICRRAGAHPVIVIDPAEPRLAIARELADVEAIAAPADAAREAVRTLTAGAGADCVLEVTGNPHAAAGAISLARDLGRIVILGSPRGPSTIDLHDEVHARGLEIVGAHNRTHPPAPSPHTPWTIERHIALFFDWVGRRWLDVARLATHRYPWRQAPAAYAMLLADRSRALGVLLDWTAP